MHELVKKISGLLRKYATHHLIFLNVLVFQNADTLTFVKGKDIIEKWIMSTEYSTTDPGTAIYTTRSMVADDNKHFLFYEETYYPAPDSYDTKLTFYDASKTKIWEKTPDSGRRISFYLSEIYNDIVTMVTTDKYNANPSLHLIKNKKTITIVDDDKWYRLASYSFSPSMKFLVLHVRNPYMRKTWDYVHFINIENKKSWTYLFPICVSCKRNKLDVSVDNDGITQVIYKGEYRIFSKDGKLTEIFIKL